MRQVAGPSHPTQRQQQHCERARCTLTSPVWSCCTTSWPDSAALRHASYQPLSGLAR